MDQTVEARGGVSLPERRNEARIGALLEELHRTGDPKLRQEVVELMRPLVRAVARKFSGREPLEDLESEGFVGLIRAVDRYSPSRGTRFSTFAVHLIAGQIRHYLRDKGHLIRQPAWLQELDRRVQRVAAQLEQRLQRQPSIEEIALAANISEEGVEELLAARQAAHVMRLEAPSDDEDGMLDVDPEKFHSKAYVTLELPIEDRIALEGAMEKLKELEKKVVYHFFYHQYNQSEIARTLGISCNYAGYVLRNGLKHLREKLSPERAAALRIGDAEESILDPVTGVYTAEHFERRLTEEVSRAQCYEHALAVACLRLPSGLSPDALARAGEVLRGTIRKADVAGRTGSAEFSVIFLYAGSVGETVAARLARAIVDAIDRPVTTAAASYPEGGRCAAELLTTARRRAAGRERGPQPLPNLPALDEAALQAGAA